MNSDNNDNTEDMSDLDEADEDTPLFVRAQRHSSLLLVFVLAFGIMTFLVPHVIERLDPPTGDEPFYLMTATSLIEDHDLDETNNYAKHEFDRFYPNAQARSDPNFPGWLAPYPLPPHASKTLHPELLISKHGLGLSVLIAPAYWLGGREGVVHFLNLLAALLGVNIFLLGWEVSGRRSIGWLVWLTFMFTAPVFCYAFLIFPEMPAALFVIYAFRRARLAAHARLEDGESGWVNGPLRLVAIALSIGILPWLHGRFLPVAIALFLYVMFGGQVRRLRTAGSQLRKLHPAGVIVAALILLTLGALYLTYYFYFYASPLPNTQDHAGFNDIPLTLFGLLGLVFDLQWGLLIYSPVYLVAIVGLVQLWRGYGYGLHAERTARGRSDLAWLLLVLLPYYIIIANYKQWWGEWGPPARYLLSVVPLLTIPMAAALGAASETRSGRRVSYQTWGAEFAFWTVYQVLLAFSLLVTLGFQIDPKLMYNQPTGQSSLAHQLSQWLNIISPSADIANLFPGYVGYLFTPDKVNVLNPAINIGIVAFVTGGILSISLALLHRRRLKDAEIVSYSPQTESQALG